VSSADLIVDGVPDTEQRLDLPNLILGEKSEIILCFEFLHVPDATDHPNCLVRVIEPGVIEESGVGDGVPVEEDFSYVSRIFMEIRNKVKAEDGHFRCGDGIPHHERCCLVQVIHSLVKVTRVASSIQYLPLVHILDGVQSLLAGFQEPVPVTGSRSRDRGRERR
jgi:hypothetical protein